MPKIRPFDLSIVSKRQLVLFEEKIERFAGCWPWTARRLSSGHGHFKIGSEAKGTGRLVLAHRLAWMLAHPNLVLGDLLICHHCDNPPCCRPDHLFRGTMADNMRDRDGKRRQARGDGHGRSKLTEADIPVIRASNETRAALGRRYGVSYQVISAVVLRKTWAHVK